MEYQVERRDEPEPRTDPRTAQLARNRARLANAAGFLLRDVPRHAQDFGYAAALVWGEPGGDALIAGMIEFAVRLAEFGHEMAAAEIEADSGLYVEVFPMQIVEREIDIEEVDPRDRIPGYLVGLFGTDWLSEARVPYLRGVAVTAGRHGREEFRPVGVLANGTVFAIPQPK